MFNKYHSRLSVIIPEQDNDSQQIEITMSKSTIAERIKLLNEVRNEFGNEINCSSLIERLTMNKHMCPKCQGKGYIFERYNAYPTNLPDSGWVEDWKYREKTCDLCKGEGWTDHEYKPRMVQDGWI